MLDNWFWEMTLSEEYPGLTENDQDTIRWMCMIINARLEALPHIPASTHKHDFDVKITKDGYGFSIKW